MYTSAVEGEGEYEKSDVKCCNAAVLSTKHATVKSCRKHYIKNTHRTAVEQTTHSTAAGLNTEYKM
jgi:hypothetical protein